MFHTNLVLSKVNTGYSSFSKRLFWYVALGFSLYWFSNLLVTFPWLLSKTLGIIAMFFSTFLWVYMSYYCLKHVPKKEWSKDAISMAFIFLITALVQDYLLFVVYRGVPDELYEFTTFVAYSCVFLIPLIVRLIFRNQNPTIIRSISNMKLFITVLIGIVSLTITLWSVKYW